MRLPWKKAIPRGLSRPLVTGVKVGAAAAVLGNNATTMVIASTPNQCRFFRFIPSP
jgi:hypothetical protein